MNFKNIIALADEAPWCGTRVPHGLPRPIPHPPGGDPYMDPLPQPWRVNETEAVFWQSVRLFQAGQRLSQAAGAGGETGGRMMSAATVLFDEYCGSVPLSDLLAWLNHRPPPPPPWLDVIMTAAVNVELSAKLGGDFGKQLGAAAAGLIATNLPEQQRAR